MKQMTERLVCLVQLIKLTEHVTGHVKKKKKKKKKRLAFSKFDVGGPEKLIINFVWPNASRIILNKSLGKLSFIIHVMGHP